MTPKEKAAPDPDPVLDPAPIADRVEPNITTTLSYFYVSTLDLGNKQPFPSTTPTDTLGSPISKDTTPVAADIGAKSIVPLPSSIIKSTICLVEDIIPEAIYALFTCPASDHQSLEYIKTTLRTADDTYLAIVSLPNTLIQLQIEKILDSITSTIQENHFPHDTPTKQSLLTF